MSVPSGIPLLRVKTNDEGKSYFVEDTILMENQLRLGSQSKMYPYKNAQFRRTTKSDRPQAIQKPVSNPFMEVHISGNVRITASDGESRIIKPGCLISYEDTTGSGHVFEYVDDDEAEEFVAVLFNM